MQWRESGVGGGGRGVPEAGLLRQEGHKKAGGKNIGLTSSFTFAHYNESLKEGTFQSTVDEMFKLNNLPRVNFPTKIVTEGITDLFNDSVKDDNVNLASSSTDPPIVDNVNQNQSDQATKVTETTKSNRDSGEFPTKKNEEKRKKENEQQTRQSTVTQTAASTFTLPKPVRARQGCHEVRISVSL